MDWVDNLISQMSSGKIFAKIDGQEVAVVVTSEAKDFFVKNKDLLRRVGKSTFKSFLALINEKKEEQAFMLLLAKMDAEDIIARLNQNAGNLAIDTDQREKFIEALKAFAWDVGKKVFLKVLLALLVV